MVKENKTPWKYCVRVHWEAQIGIWNFGVNQVKNSKRNSETVMTEVGGGLNADAMALAEANKRTCNRPSSSSAVRMGFHGPDSTAASVASMEQDNAFRFPPEEFELMSKLEQLNATGNINQSQQV